MNGLYVNVAEKLLHKYKGEEKSLKRTLAFLIKHREFYSQQTSSDGKGAFCTCGIWNDIVHLAPHNLEKRGIKYKVYQLLLYDMMGLVNDTRKILNITDEMDCICVRNEIEKNILREIERKRGSTACRVD